MGQETARAVESLRQEGLIRPETADFLLRVARRELVGVRFELLLLLWAGVLLISTGAGLLVRGHLEDIGPLTISAVIGLAAAACLAWVSYRSLPYSRGPVPAPHPAFDYILLLGMLLLGSFLAYTETQFRFLGPAWPWHLLLVSLLCLAASYRFDSRMVLSLALTSFAAWRGVAIGSPVDWHWSHAAGAARINALGTGLLFLGLALLAARARWKAHFEPVYGTLGFMLAFGAMASGAHGGSLPWLAALLLLAAAVAAWAYRRRRTLYFAVGLVALHQGLLEFLADIPLLIAFTSLAMLAAIIFVHRRFREGA